LVKRKGAKKGYHTHFIVRIIPQGKWKETERRGLLTKIQEHRNFYAQETGYDYHLFDKLLRINKRPTGNYCSICGPLYDILEDKEPSIETILFFGHHHLFLNEDEPEIITLVKMLRDDPNVKKFQMMYIDSLSEMKTTIISAMQEIDVRNLFTSEIIDITSFIDILKREEFEIRTLYEVRRDSYYQSKI
jgi:hypothetical protein